MLIYISILSISITLFLGLSLVFLKLKEKKYIHENDLAKRRIEAVGHRTGAGKNYIKVYDFYLKMPIIKQLMFNLMRSLELVGEKDRKFLIKKCVLIISGLLILSGLFVLIFWSITRSLAYTGVFVVFLWYISDSYLDFFIVDSHIKLLGQMLEFISLVRQKYYEYHVVDDAVYEATESLSPESREMLVQGEAIYNIFMVSNRDEAMSKYMETAPNTFLKMFVNFAVMTMEYGDTRDDGSSLFLTNLSFLARNIQLEIDKRKRLNYALKSMNFIVLLPLLFISPLKSWAVNNFAPLSKFYDSPAGKYVELTTIMVILLSMILLNKIQNHKQNRLRTAYLSNRLKKWKIQLDEKLKLKWLFFGVGFICSLLVMIGVSIHGRTSLQEKVYYSDSFMGGNLSPDDISNRRLESSIDYNFVKKSSPNTSLDDISLYLKTLKLAASQEERPEGKNEALNAMDKVPDGQDDTLKAKGEIDKSKQVKKASQSLSNYELTVEDELRERRIYEKIGLYHTYKVSLIQLTVALFIGGFSYMLPEMNRYISRQLNSMDLEDEIAGYKSLVMMLMHNKRMNVEEIIEWLESFSVYYKHELQRCLISLSSGEREAVLALENRVDNKEMKRLLQQLAMACEDISLVEAFDELVQEKNNFFEQRKWNNDRLINRKIILGQNIGFLPSYCLIILYLIIPMVVSSMNELGHFFEQMI